MAEVDTGQLVTEWLIEFTPNADFFKAGGDLVEVITSLSELGECAVSVLSERLPTFSDYDYEQCYLAWQFRLSAKLARKQIETQFETVQGEFELNITAVSPITSIQDESSEAQRSPVTALESIEHHVAVSPTINIEQKDSEAMTQLMIELNSVQGQLDLLGHQVQLNVLPKLTTWLELLDNQIRALQAKWQSISSCSSTELFRAIEQELMDYCQQQQRTLTFDIKGSDIQLDKLTMQNLLAVFNEWLTRIETNNSPSAEISMQCKASQNYDMAYIELLEQGLNLSHHTDKTCESLVGRYKTEMTETGSLTTFVLPAVPSLLDGQLVTLGDQDFIVPISNIVDTLILQQSDIKELSDKAELYLYEDDYIPIIRLASLFHIRQDSDESWLMIVEVEQEKVGIVLDDMAFQQSVWVKYFEHHYRPVAGFAGAARIAEGKIALILDIATIIGLFKNPILTAETIASSAGSEIESEQQVVEPLPESSADSHQPYLCFLLAGDRYAIDLLRIEEVTNWSPLTVIPNTPSHMRGLLTWRGQLIPVIDLNQKWGGSAQSCTSMTTVIVVAVRSHQHSDTRTVGLIVDSIINTYDIDHKDIKSAPDFGQRIDTANLLGLVDIEQHLTMLLDVDTLLSVEQLA